MCTVTTYMIIFRVVCFIVYPVGLIGNVVILSILWNNRLPSAITTLLFRNQCALDLFVIVVIVAYDVELLNTCVLLKFSSDLACQLWYSQGVFWLSVLLSELNLVGISLDRMFAVALPFIYREKNKLIFFSFYIFACMYSVILVMPRTQSLALNGTLCVPVSFDNSEFVRRFYNVYAYLWVAFSYVLPFSTMIISHVVVICVLKRSNTRANLSVPSPNSLGSLGSGLHTGRLNRTVNTLYKTTGLMAGLFLLTRTSAVIRYHLSFYGIPECACGSTFHIISIRLVTFGSCFNPVLLCSTVPLIRDNLSDYVKRVTFKAKRLVRVRLVC
ncbi:hypothetical protein FBUS_05185 [Fasciolopsis buskii]|uniref:G-protein coupled receptors family 1 profile domain-containing protein n=1 Tax=Fasciolopsis buskii TaxID=27845 RepID=A0A8E0VH05_9TREM|nr:hypothetical protein FBUS_05185 [Fasciolopsis buski]